MRIQGRGYFVEGVPAVDAHEQRMNTRRHAVAVIVKCLKYASSHVVKHAHRCLQHRATTPHSAAGVRPSSRSHDTCPRRSIRRLSCWLGCG